MGEKSIPELGYGSIKGIPVDQARVRFEARWPIMGGILGWVSLAQGVRSPAAREVSALRHPPKQPISNLRVARP